MVLPAHASQGPDLISSQSQPNRLGLEDDAFGLTTGFLKGSTLRLNLSPSFAVAPLAWIL